MVKEFIHESRFDHSWSSCVRAYLRRYPNPNASHIISVDVIDRRIEQRPVAGPSPSDAPLTIPVLCTTRLILKRGTLPKWAPAGIIKNAESWVMEESEIELDLFPPRPGSKSLMGRNSNGRAMRSWTRNLDHTTVLAVTEGLALKERFGFAPPAQEKAEKPQLDSVSWRNFCKIITTAQIESQVGFGLLRRRIEKFGLTRFIAHKDTSQQGILWVRDRLDPTFKELEEGTRLTREEQLKRASIPQKRFKILESLRPPFLDGYPLGPIQRLKVWWWSGHYSQLKKIRDGYPIQEDEPDSERYQGVPDDGVWQNLNPASTAGIVYSEAERNSEGGVLNRLKKALGITGSESPWATFKAKVQSLRKQDPDVREYRDHVDSQRTV